MKPIQNGICPLCGTYRMGGHSLAGKGQMMCPACQADACEPIERATGPSLSGRLLDVVKRWQRQPVRPVKLPSKLTLYG